MTNMTRKKTKEHDDDGRVIAPMNIDGMPWYTPGGKREEESSATVSEPPQPLTFRENLAFMTGVLKASLLVTMIFVGALFLFILFCTNVWFRLAKK
jgi:hypothetical protein